MKTTPEILAEIERRIDLRGIDSERAETTLESLAELAKQNELLKLRNWIENPYAPESGKGENK